MDLSRLNPASYSPGMRSQPLGYSLLHLIQLVGCNPGPDQLAVCGIGLLFRPLHRRGQVQPVIGFNVVVTNALAKRIQQAKGALRRHVALLGSLAVPFGSLRHVARNALAVAIESGQLDLGRCVAMFRSLAIPFRSLLVILRDAFAGRVTLAHLHLSRRISSVRFSQQCRVDACRLRQCADQCRRKNRHENEGLPCRSHKSLWSFTTTIANSRR